MTKSILKHTRSTQKINKPMRLYKPVVFYYVQEGQFLHEVNGIGRIYPNSHKERRKTTPEHEKDNKKPKKGRIRVYR